MPEPITAKDLAAVLHEQHLFLLKRIVRTLGEQRTTELLVEALLLEQAGGLWTREGQRRTLGGSFLQMCRERTTSAERLAIFGRRDKRALGQKKQEGGA